MDLSDTIYILPQDGNTYEQSVLQGEKGKAISGSKNV